VFKYGETYYVNDGNHRITAARALGQDSIRAEVIAIADKAAVAEGVGAAGTRPADVPSQPVGAEAVDPGQLTPDEAEGLRFSIRSSLDMSPEARKARAEEMGFDTSRVWYRGRGNPTSIEAFDVGRQGHMFNHKASRAGIYGSDSPDVASEYAAIHAVNRSAAERREADRRFAALPWYQRIFTTRPQGAAGADGANVVPFYVRNGRQIVIDMSGDGTSASVQSQLSDAIAAGYDTAILRNNSDAVATRSDGSLADEIVVFRAPDARSVNADFDPSKSDSPNLMFAFAGENARTADLDALRRAKEMEGTGKDRTSIWNDTGWFRGVDGKWRFEIDDSGSKLRRRGDAFERQYNAIKDDRYPEIRDLMRHDEMTAAYPNIMGADVRLLPRSSGFDGQYLNGTFSINRELPRAEVRPTLLHEMQHGIQDREGFSKPGKYERLTDDEYLRIASEVEARAVESRSNLTPEQRRSRPPWEDYDVPEDQQIVRGQGQESMFSIRQDAEPEPSPKAMVKSTVRAYADALSELQARANELGVDPDDLARLTEQNPETAPIAQRMEAARAQLAEAIGDDQAQALTDIMVSAAPLMRNVDPTAVANMVDGLLDQLLPDPPPARPANDNALPTPLQRDMMDLQRIEEAGTLVSVCRL